AAAEAAGRPIKVEIKVAPAPVAAPPALVIEPTPEPAPVVSAEDEGAAFPLNPHYRFDTFVVGPANEMAHAASLAVAESPARAFNPLFIYGGTGLGKTHLLHAIGQTLRQRDPGLRVAYCSAEEFTNQVIKSIHRQEMDAFRARYRNRCDVLLVDDVHVLAGKERTQEEFFYTFNALHGAQKQIVLTSDRPPQEIQHLEERLRSRFQWGLITDIKPPQFETRVAILQRKAARDGLRLPDEVAFYLARLIRANVRELEGALIRLAAYASFTDRTLNVAFAEQALRDLVENRSRALTSDAIIRLVAEHFDVKAADLRGPRRHRVIAHPRSIAMFLCRKHTQASFPQIGRSFGGKDHSTVIAACRKVENAIEDDLSMRSEVEAIERKLPG
ncbi:MAG: chromosomal replication initiator protein DnaA, partial [Myxococcales bacterium]|nr:chromosomal replication initiator protein DnaA [Myxococcales bacterium]